MQDLRQNNTERKGFSVPKFNLLLFLITYKSLIKKILIYSAIVVALISPTQVATLIANWINCFLGTLINDIKL